MRRFLPVVLSGSATCLLVAVLVLERGSLASKLFVVSFVALAFSLLYAAFGRIHLAAVASAGTALSIFLISQIKLHFWGIPFLFFDIVFLVRKNFVELLVNDYRILLAVASLVTVVVTGVWGLWRLESPRRRGVSLLGVPCVIAAVAYAPSIGEMRAMEMMDLVSWDHTVATFLISAWHSGVKLQPSSPIGSSRTEAFTPVHASESASSLPDIICILEESTFDARKLFRLGRASKDLDDFFAPVGAKSGPLRVDTFGGATWLAEFPFLTGIPNWSFGQNGCYAPFLLEGQIRHSLPSFLHGVGYHTLAVYPVAGNFVNAQRFYQSVGFDDFFDPSSLRPQRQWDWRTRDAEIFGAALDAIRDARRSANKPVFAFILTMNQHQPHSATEESEKLSDFVDLDEVEADGVGGFSEYLFRLRQSAEDLRSFRERYIAEFPSSRAVFLHFGDHHPPISWHIRSATHFKKGIPDELMQTYYAMWSIRYTLQPTSLDPLRPLDIPFLSTLLVKSIGLPSDQVFDRREAMAVHCEGRYEGCDPASLTRLHDFLLNNRLVLNQ